MEPLNAIMLLFNAELGYFCVVNVAEQCIKGMIVGTVAGQQRVVKKKALFCVQAQLQSNECYKPSCWTKWRK